MSRYRHTAYLRTARNYPDGHYLVFRITNVPMIRYHVIQSRHNDINGYRHVDYTWTVIGAKFVIRRDKKGIAVKPVHIEPAGG